MTAIDDTPKSSIVPITTVEHFAKPWISLPIPHEPAVHTRNTVAYFRVSKLVSDNEYDSFIILETKAIEGHTIRDIIRVQDIFQFRSFNDVRSLMKLKHRDITFYFADRECSMTFQLEVSKYI
jgi:hypothetical protein